MTDSFEENDKVVEESEDYNIVKQDSPHITSIDASIISSATAYFKYLKQYYPRLVGVALSDQDSPEIDLTRIRETLRDPTTGDRINKELLPFVIATPASMTKWPLKNDPSGTMHTVGLNGDDVLKTRSIQYQLKMKIYTTNLAQANAIVEAILVGFSPTPLKFTSPNPYLLEKYPEEANEFQGVILNFKEPEISKIYAIEEKDQVYRVDQIITVNALISLPIDSTTYYRIEKVEGNIWETVFTTQIDPSIPDPNRIDDKFVIGTNTHADGEWHPAEESYEPYHWLMRVNIIQEDQDQEGQVIIETK